jgi:LysM repeat protein
MLMNSRLKKKTSLLLAGLMIWTCFLSSFALSEPYRVRKGDTLKKIAREYRTTVPILATVNHISDVNFIRSGQVLIIPEGTATIQPATGGNHVKHVSRVPAIAATQPDMVADLQRGLERGWVVTRNPEGKIFVHTSEQGGVLRDLRYLIKESPNGNTWMVYRPSYSGDGHTRYGRMVGVIDKPTNVSVGECSCP